MPNFTGVIASPRLMFSLPALKASISSSRASSSDSLMSWSQQAPIRSGWRTG
jgi:hypothetical protein